MNKILRKAALGLSVLACLAASAASGDPVSIPTRPGTYIDWNYCSFNGGGGGVENGGANIGSTGSKTNVTFNLASKGEYDYTLTLATGHKGHAYMDITISDGSKTWFSGTHEITNTGDWTPTVTSTFNIGKLPAGNYVLRLKARDLTDSGYAGNWGKLALYTDDPDAIYDSATLTYDFGGYPGCGVLPSGSTYDSGANVQIPVNRTMYVEGKTLSGWTDGSKTYLPGQTFKIEKDMTLTPVFTDNTVSLAKRETAVTLCWDFQRKNGAPIVGWEGVEGLFWVAQAKVNGQTIDAILPFSTKPGKFANANWEDWAQLTGNTTFKVPACKGAVISLESYDATTTTTVGGVKIGDGTKTPSYTYTGDAESVDLVIGDGSYFRYIQVVLPAVVSDEPIEEPEENSILIDIHKGNYTGSWRFENTEATDTDPYKGNIGWTQNGDKVTYDFYNASAGVYNINIDFTWHQNEADWTFTVTDKATGAVEAETVYTVTKVHKASFRLDGRISRGEKVLTIKVASTAGDFLSNFVTFTLDRVGNEMPEPTLSATLRYESAYNQADGTWSNGLFSVSPCGDGWGGTQFKLKPGTITLSVPRDMVVRKLTLAQLKDNYEPGKVVSVTTNEEATVSLPVECGFINGEHVECDIVINVENHKAGAPFLITIEGGKQPVMWFDFEYVTAAIEEPIELKKTDISDLTGKNHAVVAFMFDREVKDAVVMFEGKDIKADGGSTSLLFSLWNLEYDKDYTFVIPAGTLADNYGNTNAEALTCDFRTGVKHEDVVALDTGRFVEVSTVEELRAAVAGLKDTNNKADSPRSVIYIHNGDYDLGATPLETGKNIYNISLVGESEEGVLIHGLRDGISNPVFSTRNSTNVYMENFTVRNDLDFGADKRVGVGVAHYGGNLDIMKNVTLQSIQDTQVTGERGYYLNCTIHGNVDYICGGGDHFYDHCTLVHRFSGGFITAPSTSPANKYGYVFSNCEIKGDAGYNLGRPWQNEPRCYWLNTTMHSSSSEGGWGPMGELTTHFYEYGSKDSEGNPIDLGKRTNSPTSLNKYTPVLTADEAASLTVENVVGGKDSFLATELTAELEAPVATYYGSVIGWKAVKGAAGYFVYVNGRLHGFTSDTLYDLAASRKSVRTRADGADTYTVRAVSAHGSQGALSAAAVEDPETGMSLTGAEDAPAEYYTLQGVRVAAPKAGIFIRVAAGKAEKVVIR